MGKKRNHIRCRNKANGHKTEKSNSKKNKPKLSKFKKMMKEKERKRELERLIKEQGRDMKNPSGIDNQFDPKSQDIYARRHRSWGSGFSRR